MEYTASGHLREREGNRAPHAAPQGLDPCRGDERWLALPVVTDAQWQALVRVVGERTALDELERDGVIERRPMGA
jgi:benzylsuccinate CoA-transferase BbsF subunit